MPGGRTVWTHTPHDLLNVPSYNSYWRNLGKYHVTKSRFLDPLEHIRTYGRIERVQTFDPPPLEELERMYARGVASLVIFSEREKPFQVSLKNTQPL